MRSVKVVMRPEPKVSDWSVFLEALRHPAEHREIVSWAAVAFVSGLGIGVIEIIKALT